MHQVEDGEEQHPDQIDQVPVGGTGFDVQCVVGSIDAAPRHHGEVAEDDHAQQDMQEVQAVRRRARWAMVLGIGGVLAGVIAAIAAVRMPGS